MIWILPSNRDLDVFNVESRNILAFSARGSAREPKVLIPLCAPETLDAFCTNNECYSLKTRS